MAYRLIGKDFTPPDVAGESHGPSEICRRHPYRRHGVREAVAEPDAACASVRNIDASEALAMDGVVGILTADDLPEIKVTERSPF